MHLVDDQLIPGRHGELIRPPGILPIEDDAVSDGTCDFLRARVNPPLPADNEGILLPHLGAGKVHGPVAVSFRRKRRGGRAPRVELTGHEDRGRKGRPDAEGHSA